MENAVRRHLVRDTRRCAFTGYRPAKMPFGYDENTELALNFKRRMRATIEMLI